MKRILSFSLVLIMVLSLFSVSVSAEEIDPGTVVDIEYLDNGYYIVTYLGDTVVIDDDSDATTVVKSKTRKFYNSSGATMWYVTVTGKFRYTGSSSTCLEAAHAAGAPGSTWSIVSASHSKSGSTAKATATARHQLNPGYSDYTRSVSLTCSANGSFS